jgi:hypothetical protein
MAETKEKAQKKEPEKKERRETIGMDEALTYIGARVDDSGGGRLGKVSGIHVDAASNDPKWLVVKIGRFAGDAAIPFEHTAPVAGRVWVAYERDEVRNSPKLSAGQALSAKQELQLCDHYGIRSGIGRAAEVEELEADEISAVPAAG